MNLAQQIKHLRQIRGFSQDYVSKKLGISQRAYSKMERNEIKINIYRLYDIARILEVDLIDLIQFDLNSVLKTSTNSGDSVNAASAGLLPVLQWYEKRFEQMEKEIHLLKVNYSLN